MNVKLLSYTASPEWVAAEAAAVCTDSDNPDRALHHALESGHDSISEHASFTFLISGVSRVFLAQITRHRIASFSVESQRYVGYRDCFGYVIPPKIRQMGDEYVDKFRAQMEQMHYWYNEWTDLLGDETEDARFVLPGATQTRMMVTMNARELNHFFSLRCCNRAQWEIREAADKMLAMCKEVAPKLFENAGPGCVRGHCPEKKPCGHPRGGAEA
jgi:thymidylate synthase (FAD)